MSFKKISKLIIVHLVISAIFWINAFPLSKPGAVLSNTKVPGQLSLGNTVDYNNIFHLNPGEDVQVNQEDEPRNTVNIDHTVRVIVLGAQ